jgi:predicted O-linked N-acetylglucosamine transferase (SPINDLY family)
MTIPAEARHREGLAHMARREFAQAAACFEDAARLAPGHPAAWLALGLARRELGEAGAALAAFARAREIDPAMPQASAQMGLALQAMGRLPEAIACLAEEAARFPQVPRNHNNLGLALAAAGRDEEAQAAFVEAVRLDRDYAMAHANLAALFQRKGDLRAAEAGWRQVIRIRPDDAPAHAHLGHLLASGWRAAEAEPVLRRAMALDAESTAPARTLAWVLCRLNRPEEARAVARSILARRPDDLQASVVEALALPVVYGSAAHLAGARERYARGLDGLVAGLARFEAAPAQALALAWENFTLAYQGGDDRPLQEKYARFVSRLARHASPRHYEAKAPRARAPGERLRVGFLSSFLRDCTAGKYFRSWITDLPRDRFEVFAYYTGHVTDDFSTALSRAVEHYRRLAGPAVPVADAVLADALDVLVYPDVGMDTASYLLAGMRLAPVQCAGWGHPVTTGQAGIDCFLSCDAMEPAGAQAHYTERLVRLPGIGTRYARPAMPASKPRAALGLPEDGPLFLCPQSLFKIHPDNDALFAAVLAAAPAARLVFFRDHDEPLTTHFRARLLAALAAHGVDGEARTVFLGRLDHADYLRVNAACDAMLDTLHWSGGNTTLDALAAGLPVVTLPGAFMRGRQSAAMLGLLEMPELVARDGDDYARIAARLAGDRAWREEVAARIRAGSGALFDRPEPVEALAAFLESAAPARA